MPLGPDKDWVDAFASMPTEKGPAWSKTMADTVDRLSSNLAQLTGITGSVSFTFNKAVFMSQLMTLKPNPAAPAAMMGFATAWGAAMQASIMVVAPGSFLGVSSPATIWSVVFSTVIDPPSVAAGQQFLAAALSALPAVPGADKSQFGPTFRKAFLMCTATTLGLNSLPPPPAGPGPLPFPAPLVPFL